PDPAAAASVRFAFSGDCDGLMRPYALASLFPSQNLDFFVFLGDTIYENASAGSPSVTLSGTIPAPSTNGATRAQLFNDYSKKYREQFLPVNPGGNRSEEHTSELQSRGHLVCRLLLEKKKKSKINITGR